MHEQDIRRGSARITPSKSSPIKDGLRATFGKIECVLLVTSIGVYRRLRVQ
jgi:hypothetical protein